jgi:hypothetical protein
MVDTLRIKRRPAGGAAGAPSSLAAAEIAFNEQDNVLYYGKGNSAGLATSVIPIAGPGGFVSKGGDTMTGALTVSATTVSTTPTTGALIVGGGVGIGGNININGGAVVGGEFRSGDMFTYRGATEAGILFFGSTATKYLYQSGTLFSFTGTPVAVLSATASTSPSSGALQVAGGLGVGLDIHVGGSVFTDVAFGSPSANATSQTQAAIANGSSAAIATGVGGYLIFVSNQHQGQSALYMVDSAGHNNMVSAVGAWIAGTTTPAAGKTSVAWDGSASFRVYNNIGATQNFNSFVVKIR